MYFLSLVRDVKYLTDKFVYMLLTGNFLETSEILIC